MDWKIAYQAYPVNRELIWLNNCGTVPAGNHVVDAVCRFMKGYSEKGILTEVAEYEKVKHRIKTILSDLLKCQPEELALIHNTAEGMNFISHGMHLKAGDEIILLENEYPSNVYPWRHWEEKGVKIITTPMESSPDAFFESLNRHITENTRMVSISAVHWCTGMPLPLVKVGGLCRKMGIWLVVDGAQGVGMQPIDVKRANISFMAFSAWKWLMGPLGLGVLYISKELLNVLNPIFIGTRSVVRPEEYLPYKTALQPGADRFAFSTASFIDWIYFLTSLEFLDSIGFETVRKRIYELCEHLSQGLRQLGFEVFSDRFSKHPTGIAVCNKPGKSAKDVVTYLKDNGVIAAVRLDRMRLSPHIYNSPQQLERVLEILQGFKG